jgi:hypothetical protein
MLERLRNTPTHLCRLRYFGDPERWGFAFYTYSNERYELSVFPFGGVLGPARGCLPGLGAVVSAVIGMGSL